MIVIERAKADAIRQNIEPMPDAGIGLRLRPKTGRRVRSRFVP